MGILIGFLVVCAHCDWSDKVLLVLACQHSFEKRSLSDLWVPLGIKTFNFCICYWILHHLPLVYVPLRTHWMEYKRNSYFILPFELDRPLDGCMESLHDDNIFDNSQLKMNIVHACMLTFSASSRHISLTPCSEPFELRKARRWSWQ